MTSVIRPYADVEGIFTGLDYRGNFPEPRQDDRRDVPAALCQLRKQVQAAKARQSRVQK